MGCPHIVRPDHPVPGMESVPDMQFPPDHVVTCGQVNKMYPGFGLTRITLGRNAILDKGQEAVEKVKIKTGTVPADPQIEIGLHGIAPGRKERQTAIRITARSFS